MPRERRSSIAAALLLSALLVAAWYGHGLGTAPTPQPDPFPHEKHAKLFPVCEGCHAGLVEPAADVFPEPAACAQCHDGARIARVDWQPPPPRASNLRFSHVEHVALAAAGGEPADCASCHVVDDATSRMQVTAPAPDRCLRCHVHAAETHLAESVACNRCHVPLADATTLPPARIAHFPRPEGHEAADFVSTHGTKADGVSCSVCHARDTCERCHANAERLPAVMALARDARVGALEVGRLPTYPLPTTHEARDWSVTHATPARTDPASCANCHTQPSCTACHGAQGTAMAVIASLPKPRPGAPASSAVRSRVHAPDIAVRHGTIAATGALACARCHTTETCTSCHAAADSRAFHAQNFVERHAVEVFANGSDCQSCHSTETFCRACHARAGVAAQAAMSAAFHTAQPLWLLSHGQAARTGLEACASCHRQNDCVRCHSAAGGWGVNPHGRGFSGSRAASRSPGTCQTCHFGNPLGRD